MSGRGWRVVLLIVRLLLAGLLLFAGLSKVQGGWQFAEAIANYRLLPGPANQILAVALPWLEIVAGLLLLCGLWIRAAAIVSLLLFTAFAVAVITAMVRGLDIDCGCFGTESSSRVGLNTLAIDLLCLAAALVLVLFARHARGITRPVRQS